MSKKVDSKPKTEKKDCGKKVYCQQCNDFISNLLSGGKTYCKQGYNCYEHAKTLRALYINKVRSGGEKTRSLKIGLQDVVKASLNESGGDVGSNPTETSKLPEPISPCKDCKHEFPSISQRCKDCCKTVNYDGFEPKEKAEPEKDEEPWECPICHKTVFIGYTTHRHCLDKLMEELEKYPKIVYQLGTDSKEYMELKKKYDKLIEGFLREIVELYFSLGDDKVEKFKFASLKQEYEGG